MKIPKYSNNLTHFRVSDRMFGPPVGPIGIVSIEDKKGKRLGTMNFQKTKQIYVARKPIELKGGEKIYITKNSFYHLQNNSMEKKINVRKEIAKLPDKKQNKIIFDYERRKLNMGSAWALRFFGFHYLHTNKVGLWFLYLLSCFLYVGIIRRIVQAFMLKDQIEKKNEEILEMIYWENVA